METMTGWLFLTRWGNAILLLPLAACLCVGLWVAGDRRVAWRWAVCFGSAVLLVFATKLAFLGWGLGIRSLDFTGISGHSTLAASVLPVFAWWLTQGRRLDVQRRAVVAAVVLALLVGVSRLLLQTHSISEVIAGLALGNLVAWAVIPRGVVTRHRYVFRGLVLAALLVAGLVPGVGQSGDAHGLVQTLALRLSGRSEPYTRDMLFARRVS
ncbi:MAG: phosphatase PAP2 family protein [Burkholderiaceae bacterium]